MSKIKIAMAVVAAVMVLSTSAIACAPGGEPPATPTPPTAGQTFWQTLADNLGIPLAKLEAAVRDTLKTMVDKALSSGKLTQDQADKAKGNIDKMPFDKQPFGGFLGGRGFDGARARFDTGTTAFDAAAQKLGMTTQDLMTELRNGKTLADVASAKGVSSADLKDAIVTAVGAKLDQAVKDGNLTQAQADQIKAQVDKMTLDQSFGMGRKGGFGPGWNGFKGLRPFGPRGNHAPQPATPQGSSS
jgi:hypothetical protein